MNLVKQGVDLHELAIAIDKRHHACERFYDIAYADQKREEHNEILANLMTESASDEDVKLALDLIKHPM